MGANAQTSVPTFTAGEVLTAANMNISARTGVPVFADTTARDAGFGGTGEKTLAEGQLCYLESTNVVQYYDGAVWATVGPTTVSSGLTLISSTTVGSGVSSVTVSNCFSSTYDNYRIQIIGGTMSTNTTAALTFGATTTGYYYAAPGYSYGGAASSSSGSNQASFAWVLAGDTNSYGGYFDCFGPNLATNTRVAWTRIDNTSDAVVRVAGGILANTTQYTAFTLTMSTGTLTGGTIRVYGYANS